MTAYYNENNPKAAASLRELISAGHIAPGIVDERSIEDVFPSDLRGFAQCHFFAGIGVWSYALRAAGWSDDRPVWTGSCPCQPFSAAGEGAGFDDKRHLWPHWHHLISQCRPPDILGEQVASKDADPWVDLVCADLEAMGYAFGAVPFPSAGVGAPHIRDRCYWVANAHNPRLERRRAVQERSAQRTAGARSVAGGMAHAECERVWPCGPGCADGASRALQGIDRQRERLWLDPGAGDDGVAAGSPATGPTNGIWRDADWLLCRDGKWRPVEPRPQPLVDGSAESLGRVSDSVIAKVEEEVNAATAQTEGGRAAAMRALLEALGAEAQRCWPFGGIPGLHEAPFLLAFMRQLQEQGWRIAEGVALPRAEASSGLLRGLRDDAAVAGASHRRGLEEQRSDEPADPVRVLSCVLARHAQAAWDHAHAAYAEIGFPLAHGARNRVARLHGYGNAINAEAAKAWIEIVMEAA